MRALPLAAGTNEGGHYFRYIFPLVLVLVLIFLPPLFKTTEGVVVLSRLTCGTVHPLVGLPCLFVCSWAGVSLPRWLASNSSFLYGNLAPSQSSSFRLLLAVPCSFGQEFLFLYFGVKSVQNENLRCICYFKMKRKK